MKTITKEFYVSDEELTNIRKGRYMNTDFNDIANHFYKNKIIVSFEIPEKTITVSESEFDRLSNSTNRCTSPKECMDTLRKVLFGE